MKRLTGLLLALVLPTLALAAKPPIEASMVLTGTITVSPDGSVKAYTLHNQDQVPPGVVNLVKQTIRGWQFVPIVEEGKAVTAQAGMTVRVVAKMADADAKQMTVRVAGAQFGCNAGRARQLLPDICPAAESIGYQHRTAPRYPMSALAHGVGGEVFLVLQVGRDGRVAKAAVRKVNLSSLTPRQAYYREVLAGASLKAARNWKFQIPTLGPDAAKDHWVVQVPIHYRIRLPSTGTLLRSRSSQWNAYIPGPVHDVPWDHEDAPIGSADAITGGAPFVKDTRFILKTPLGADADRS